MASKIHKRKDSQRYVAYFSNPITRKSEQIGSSNKLDTAINMASEKDVEFYSEHPYLIPPGITLDKSNKRFRVYTRYSIMEASSTLLEAVEVKDNIIKDLTEMKYSTSGKTGLFTNF